jgi:hypothetical protein
MQVLPPKYTVVANIKLNLPNASGMCAESCFRLHGY